MEYKLLLFCAAWRSVKLSALAWPSWSMGGSSAWVQFSTSRTSTKKTPSIQCFSIEKQWQLTIVHNTQCVNLTSSHVWITHTLTGHERMCNNCTKCFICYLLHQYLLLFPFLQIRRRLYDHPPLVCTISGSLPRRCLHPQLLCWGTAERKAPQRSAVSAADSRLLPRARVRHPVEPQRRAGNCGIFSLSDDTRPGQSWSRNDHDRLFTNETKHKTLFSPQVFVNFAKEQMDDEDRLREVAVNNRSDAAQSLTSQQSSQTVYPLLTTSFKPKRSVSQVIAAQLTHPLSSAKSSQPEAAWSKTKESKCSGKKQPQQIEMEVLVDFSANGIGCTDEDKSQSKDITKLFVVNTWITSRTQILIFFAWF